MNPLLYVLIVAVGVVACVRFTSVRVGFALLAACIACLGCMAAQDGAVFGSAILFLEAAFIAAMAASRVFAPWRSVAPEDTAT